MPTARVEELITDEEWNDAVPVIRQLWSHRDEEFVRSWREEDGYHLFGLYADGTLVAVAGVSIQRVMHHARHAWIHDFVVDETHRNEGYGTEILDFVEAWAEEADCEYVALACLEDNDAAISFYEENDLETWGCVMEKEI